MQLKLLTALISIGLAAAGAHAQVTDQMIQAEATATGNVLTWGINTQGQRYSPLEAGQRGHRRQARCRCGRSRSAARSSAARNRSR